MLRNIVIYSSHLPCRSPVRKGATFFGNIQARGFSVLKKCTETADPLKLLVHRHSGAIDMSACHPQVERHQNRHTATEALEAARAAAQRGDFVKARELLAAAIETLSNSKLTQAGDMVSSGLLSDLNECQ